MDLVKVAYRSEGQEQSPCEGVRGLHLYIGMGSPCVREGGSFSLG